MATARASGTGPTHQQPLRPESDLTGQRRFLDLVQQAADRVRAAKRVGVLCDSDGDGISAGGLVAVALHRIGTPFQVIAMRGLSPERAKRVEKMGCDLVLICDLGSTQLEIFDSLGIPAIILDHHPPGPEDSDILVVNPHRTGIDGTFEACSATVAYSLARALEDRTIARFGTALAGMLSDKQDRGGLRGLNRRFLTEAVEKGIVGVRHGLALGPGPVGTALTDAVEPLIVGLAGQPKAVTALLKDLRIDPATPVRDLGAEESNALTSVLLVRLLQQGVRPEIARDLVGDRYWLEKDGMDGGELAEVINACGRLSKHGRGIAGAMGDPSARDEGRGFAADWRARLRTAVLTVADRGAESSGAVQLLRLGEPALAGEVAGIAMDYLLDQERPVVAMAPIKDRIKISTRGTAYLVHKGLDLGKACNEGAMAVEGVGGGHPIASGALIPGGSEQRFLDVIADVVGRQLSAPAAAGLRT